jgi:hypothetical protein
MWGGIKPEKGNTQNINIKKVFLEKSTIPNILYETVK